jgi:hypothetical protein
MTMVLRRPENIESYVGFRINPAVWVDAIAGAYANC